MGMGRTKWVMQLGEMMGVGRTGRVRQLGEMIGVGRLEWVTQVVSVQGWWRKMLKVHTDQPSRG